MYASLRRFFGLEWLGNDHNATAHPGSHLPPFPPSMISGHGQPVMPWAAEQYQEAVYRHHLMLQGQYAAMVSGQPGGIQQSAYPQGSLMPSPPYLFGQPSNGFTPAAGFPSTAMYPLGLYGMHTN